MQIKEEVTSVEVSFDEIGIMVHPNLMKMGFKVDDVVPGEMKISIGDSGEIHTISCITVKFRRGKD